MRNSDKYLIAAVVLIALGMICVGSYANHKLNVEQTRLEMEMRKLKAEKGNQFKFGLTQHERPNQSP